MTNYRVWYYCKQCEFRMLFFEANLKKKHFTIQFLESWCNDFFMKIDMQTFVFTFLVEIYHKILPFFFHEIVIFFVGQNGGARKCFFAIHRHLSWVVQWINTSVNTIFVQFQSKCGFFKKKSLCWWNFNDHVINFCQFHRWRINDRQLMTNLLMWCDVILLQPLFFSQLNEISCLVQIHLKLSKISALLFLFVVDLVLFSKRRESALERSWSKIGKDV